MGSTPTTQVPDLISLWLNHQKIRGTHICDIKGVALTGQGGVIFPGDRNRVVLPGHHGVGQEPGIGILIIPPGALPGDDGQVVSTVLEQLKPDLAAFIVRISPVDLK